MSKIKSRLKTKKKEKKLVEVKVRKKIAGNEGKVVNLRETPRHREAFETYLKLEGDRTYWRVAKTFGVCESTIGDWAKRFQWEERLAKYNKKFIEKVMDKSASCKKVNVAVNSFREVLEIKNEISTALAKSLLYFAEEMPKKIKYLKKRIKKGKAKNSDYKMDPIKTAAEFKTYLDAFLTLIGDSTSKRELVLTDNNKDNKIAEHIRNSPAARDSVIKLWEDAYGVGDDVSRDSTG